MKVKKDKRTGLKQTYMEPEEPKFEYCLDGAVPLEAEAGSIVLLHGGFTHFSARNTSDK